ncbi:MAG: subunit BbsF of succinyl-CoA:(R)-benzylsuccinate CoA-transferase [Ramlibacter sp.]|jgi:crotonobetainyl-CoA:carnitine CoA-transferase CaiB-like acyl-CoA transferase|nr:subunit BbsF of succinyl-CoA:(R)-benzylsuccinate CoA-transferase [Ramlibacter sp.]
MALPLEGVRVLDLTNVMAGPYCATVLGDMGADIVKIEAFPDGDTTRRFEPQVNGESYCFAVLNRNKKSLALDMKDPRGKEIVMKLAEKADIVIENFRPGVVKKLGIDYESFKARNPGIIYASMSGFGQTGPYGKKGGFDIIAQGMSGIMMMTGYPGGRPAKVGIAMNDIASGVTALYGILGAYIGKLRFGTGQYLETSLLEAGLAWSIWEFGAFFGGGEIPTATGTRHRRSAPYQAYRSKDGYVTVGAGSEKLWSNFCTMVCGKPEWMTDPRFSSLALRLKNNDELEREIEAVLTTQTTAYWVEKLDAAQVPAGPVYGFEQIMKDPHVKFRKMVVDIDHPKIGPMKTLGLPIKSTGDLTAIRKPAPMLGQHSEEVLRELGYGDADIRTLFDDQVIFDSSRNKARSTA